MAKKHKKKIEPSEIPAPVTKPEINPAIEPDAPAIPEFDPDSIPEEDPFETPPYEIPEPGEAP